MNSFDVIVIGGGGAGAAAAVAARRAGARVALLSKEPAGYGDTRIAEGAFAYPGRTAEDSPEFFCQDIKRSGEQLCDDDLVQTLARESEAGIYNIEEFGYLFRRDTEGRLSSKTAYKVGGHSTARAIIGAGRGINIGVTVRAACARAGVTVIEDTMAVRLLVMGGRVAGVQVYDFNRGEYEVLSGRAVILATGGTGWLYYPHTDCSRSVTGDGFALALQAGASLVEMEQVQFMPFAITHPDSMVGIMCGEPASAGPHGRLIDCEGKVVLEGVQNFNRAQVTRVMAQALKEGRGGPHGGLFLDMAPNLEAPGGMAMWQAYSKAAPMMKTVRAAYGEDAYHWKTPWEVLPTAHYHMGGVRADANGNTGIPGLYAAGGVQGGVHGGNRLGSVALTEIFVFGRRAGEAAAQEALAAAGNGANGAPEPVGPAVMPGRKGRHRPIQLVRRLQKTMWECVGPVRDEQGIRAGLGELDRLEEESADLAIGSGKRCNQEMRDALELPLMLLTARAIMASALERRESRGAHLRSDFPESALETFHTVARLTEQRRLSIMQERIAQ